MQTTAKYLQSVVVGKNNSVRTFGMWQKSPISTVMFCKPGPGRISTLRDVI